MFAALWSTQVRYLHFSKVFRWDVCTSLMYSGDLFVALWCTQANCFKLFDVMFAALMCLGETVDQLRLLKLFDVSQFSVYIDLYTIRSIVLSSSRWQDCEYKYRKDFFQLHEFCSITHRTHTEYIILVHTKYVFIRTNASYKSK